MSTSAVERLAATVRLCVHYPTSVDVPNGPRGRTVESQYERWTSRWHSRTRSCAGTSHLQPGAFLDPLNCALPSPWTWPQGLGLQKSLTWAQYCSRKRCDGDGEVPVGSQGAEMAVRSFTSAAERTPRAGARGPVVLTTRARGGVCQGVFTDGTCFQFRDAGGARPRC